MCKSGSCGCGESSGGPLAAVAVAVLAVVVSGAAALIASVLLVLLMAGIAVSVAGTGYLVYILQRDGLRLWSPGKAQAALPSADARPAILPATPLAIEAPKPRLTDLAVEQQKQLRQG